MTATRRLLYVLNALIVLQLCSCSADESVSTNEQAESEVQMTFDVSAEQSQTRGEVINNISDFKTEGRQFKLWCWMTDGTGTYPMTSDFNKTPLTAIPVTYSTANGWTTEQTFYWPRPKFRADFFAIYPADIETSFTKTTKTITYTSDAPFNGNTDLMYATYSDKRAVRDNSEKSRVVYLTFHHAMARIMFYGQLSDEYKGLGWDIEVKKIELHNLNGAGVFTLSSDYTKLGKSPDEAMSFVPDDPSNDPSPLTSYPLAMNTTGDVENPVYPVISGSQLGQLSSPTNVLMVLPQTLTAWTPSTASATPSTTDGYIAVELRAIAHDGETVTYPLKTGGGYITIYAPFGSPTSGFQAGNTYKYTLTLGSSVSMTAAITPWTTETITPDRPLFPNTN